ncbi:MAG: glycoside hydrolase family 2 protein, partial [Phycisphaerales bacterium]|nr:glycoside hydrolase family 2 protein [Phycisphaerales bacterium]
MRRSQPLRETEWTLRPADPAAGPRTIGVIDARVPGCVHDALIAAGIIDDPLRNANEAAARWVGETDWIYETRFTLDPSAADADRVELVCAGLDTVATVFIDDAEIGRAASAHVTHRFDLRGLASGEHALSVHFRGPLAAARAEERARGTRPVNGDWGPYAYLRKPACHFGWDWGPQLPTAGFWAAPVIETWSGARICHVRPLVRTATPEAATIDVHVDFAHATPADRRVEIRLTGPGDAVMDADALIPPDAATVCASLEVPAPALWWPAGYGDQPLYSLVVTLEGDDETLDAWTDEVGLRTVRLDTSGDESGTAFTLLVNDRPIFAQGANWIPTGLFPRADDAERAASLIAAARDAHMNMIRVWGGGRYEGHDFYRACDRAGLLVWQDFMFACATYPEEPPFPDLIEREAREQVARLARHPSVCLWCGGNENILAYRNWDGWRDALAPGQTWGRRYWLELLPRVTAEVDPSRPYWSDSPYSGEESRDPNDPDHGDRHTWDLRFDEVRQIVPRFVSEFGHQAPPALATWREAVDEPFALDGLASRRRQRAWGGNEREFVEPLERWFRCPPDHPSVHGLAQILQARS